MKIGIVAYKNCTASMIMGVVDILSLANSQMQGRKKLFDIEIITRDGKPVISFNGIPIRPSGSILSSRFDLIYVPGFLADPLEVLASEKIMIDWLRKQGKKAVTLTAACNGNLLLAESGVLHGKQATTHWSLKDFFENRYPDIQLTPEKIVVDEGDTISAAGVTAYNNLALHLVAKFASAEVAAYCSKVFLVDSGRKLQTPYLIYSAPKNHGDDEIKKIQEWMEVNFEKPFTLESVLRKSSLGVRTMIRRFKRATGDTPLEYLQRIRIEKAKRYLETTSKTFSEITWDVGYNDISSFQRLFKTNTRLTPREYRDKFTLVG
ncbi:MAG TPA: helix-turn-helix domain-containing protein [Cyclobacteriaceae bacterium]|nr:helix-turn-helix domain-containing protein [Cyclobacteriaceae bacterium]